MTRRARQFTSITDPRPSRTRALYISTLVALPAISHLLPSLSCTRVEPSNRRRP
uniref:Uncharacterized protein n=1 Tax=Arundo donax TaxID=35708 RepID=A0A0A9B9V6_ARUDO